MNPSARLVNELQAGVTELTADYQVLQRDEEDQASCALEAPAGITQVKIIGPDGALLDQALSGEGVFLQIEGLPVGGPYEVTLLAGEELALGLAHVLVGDLWVLAGQSNMQGLAPILEQLPALPEVNMLGMSGQWQPAVPPLHRLFEADHPFFELHHHTVYQLTDKQLAANRAASEEGTPWGGMDAGYSFAKSMVQQTGVPVGLIPTAYGGSAIAEWDPDKRSEKGGNFYDFMERQINLAGGHVRGLVWYQGESDARMPDFEPEFTDSDLDEFRYGRYGRRFDALARAFRTEFATSEAPVVMVQLGRWAQLDPGFDGPWERFRDMQRRLPEAISNLRVVPAIDLDLSDPIHIGWEGQLRLGRRIARVAAPLVDGSLPPKTELRLAQVKYGDSVGSRIFVEFEGVEGRLTSQGMPAGFRLRNSFTSDDLDALYNATFDADHPNRIVLWAAAPLPEGTVLWYGAGCNPYCNVTDADDMAAPCFGPVEILPSR